VKPVRIRPLALACTLALLLSCATSEEPPPAPETTPRAEAVPTTPGKQALFGDVHIHSRWSFDAYSNEVPVGPEQAYRYARGEAIDHYSGEPIQLKGPPLDFMALTEHGSYMGVSASIDDETSPLRAIPLIQDLIGDDEERQGAAFISFLTSLSTGVAIPELVTDAVVEPTWRHIATLADRHYVPGEFTSFVAYEYTPMPDGQNLHRNVIFRGSRVPKRPFTSIDSQNPEDLWDWMDRVRGEGDDVLSIPHNQNASNGLMYARFDTSGAPIDAAYAEQRLRNEPVSEVMQIKGTSDTHPDLSPEDEWADFELFDRILGRPIDLSEPRGSYARDAFKTGLEMDESGGFNPYKFGVIGSSDGHNASSPVEEDNYTGKIGRLDGTREVRMTDADPIEGFPTPLNLVRTWGAAGLAAVWAESNTREAIFDAFRARETFATSGPRIRVRLFGGWDFDEGDLGDDLVTRGYARGVPMGGELSGGTDAAPTFVVRALRDPREAPLERVQIIKGWIEDDAAHERVFDVACADGTAPDPATHRCGLTSVQPDLSDCSYTESSGAAQLSALFRDPTFDASQRAFYYVRVLQIPTCRWSTWDAHRMGIPIDDSVPPTIQERAITSPIWYAPSAV
jgi:hypothetical protein